MGLGKGSLGSKGEENESEGKERVILREGGIGGNMSGLGQKG